MNNIVSLVAEHADIDTRRAMGFPPRKLSSVWKDFTPRPYNQEIFKYFVRTKTLLYYEFWKYQEFYSEVTKGIVPKSRTRHKWEHLPGCTVQGIRYDNSDCEMYINTMFQMTYTAGWPIFVQN